MTPVLEFSVIIPTYARPAHLAACLESLARLDYPRDRFEVIVVDDGSSDRSVQAIADAFRQRLHLTFIEQPHRGSGAARNAGASRAEGEFLAFTDDDCAPAPQWLRALAAWFDAQPDRAIGGRVLNALTANPYSTASQLLIDYLYSYYNVHSGGARFFASLNLAVPREQFSIVGGFDETFTRAGAEDRELCDRWLHIGYGMIYAPEAVVYHAHPLTFWTFWRQHFNYGRGAFGFHRARARRSGAFRIEPPTFYLNLLWYPFPRLGWRRAVWLAFLLVLSQVANMAGFFREAVGHAGKSLRHAPHEVSGSISNLHTRR